MKYFISFKQFLTTLEKAFLILSLLGMISISFLQVCLRHFFSSGLVWADVFLRHLVLWVGFIGAALTTTERKHFTISVLDRLWNQKTKRWLDLIIHLFGLTTLTALILAASGYWKEEWISRSILFTVSNFAVPSAWAEIILPLGFSLLWIHFFINAVEDLFSQPPLH